MALGRLEALYEQTGKPASVRDRFGAHRAHLAWEGNHAWDKYAEQYIVDAPMARGYIKEWRGSQTIFNLDYRPRAGRIALYDTHEEWIDEHLRIQPRRFVIIQPNNKAGASINKRYPLKWWQAIADAMPLPVVQLYEREDERKLTGVTHLRSASFRQACAAIKAADLVVCGEGGMHHMAASMGIPAVVYFGSFVPPEVTGYPIHRNLAVRTATGACGNYDPCRHCQDSLGKYPPDVVVSHVAEVLSGGLNAENSICWL
jgi:ADP-heptose:LPS heptosyltransferase